MPLIPDKKSCVKVDSHSAGGTSPDKQVVVLIHNAMLHLLGSNPTIFLIVWSSIVGAGAEPSLSDALHDSLFAAPPTFGEPEGLL